jgi:GH15 family glucan-1,4-alpha-glucosidase
MKSLPALLPAALAALATLVASGGEAQASPQRTWNFLTTGNGYGFQVYDTNQKKIVSFLDHPYRYTGPRADPKSDGFPRRNLAFDLYFGLRGSGGAGWLNQPTSAGEAEYVEETSIIHAPVTLGSVSADSYFFSPFDFDGNLVVGLLHAPGASDGFILLNFHMGGTQDAPDSNGESVTAIAAQQALSETGPGGGAMVYVPLSGVDHTDCQGVYAKVMGGQDLGSMTACSGNDVAPGFQKKLGSDGWMAVGIGFVENASGASTMAKQISDWGAGRAPDKIFADAKAEWDGWRKPPPAGTALCTDDQKKVWRQSEAVLRMGQVRETNTAARKNNGMILASLPPGEWHTGWVRDGTFATVALARSGHVAEAKASLDFFLNATPAGKYKQFVGNQDYRISVVRYFGSGEEEADYSGQSTPNVEIDGWGMVIWAARQYVEASGDTAWLSSPTKLGPTVYQAMVSGIAKPLEANLETQGIAKADSGIWEVHDANKKHFAFTTMAAARGFCDMAALAKKAGQAADATKYQKLSAKMKAAFLATFIDSHGALGGSLEGISNNRYDDGAVAAAFTWNILDDFGGSTAKATLDGLGMLKVASGGFKRNDDGLSSYDNNEWILVDLLISNALRRNGQIAEADSYVDLVVGQAAANYYLLPELYNAVPSDGAIGKYTGSIPMVGYGGGAYLMTMLDRSGLIEPNDCGDGAGATLPAITCGGQSSGNGSQANGNGAGAGNPAGAGGGDSGAPPYGTGACLCRAGGPGGVDPGAVLLLLGGVPSLLALRRRSRRSGKLARRR